MFGLLMLLSLVLAPLSVQAQPVTWTQLDIRDTDVPLRALIIRGVTADGSLLGDGRFVDFRVAPDRTTLTPITCPNIAHDPTQVRRGPDVHGINSLRTVVGEDVIVRGGQDRSIAGILQPDTGTTDCVLVQRPGAVSTFLQAINDAGTSAGVSVGPNVSLGLRRFEGFTRAPDGTFTPLTGVCNSHVDANGQTVLTADVLFPEAMAGSWLVGYGYCDVRDTNEYRYEAFFCQDGAGCQTLRDPEGQTLAFVAVTSTGMSYGSQAVSENSPIGKAYRINLAVTPPDFTELPLPPPTTPGGTVRACHPTAAGPQGWVCASVEEIANCPPSTPHETVNCMVAAQWLALYTTPPATTPTVPGRGPRPRDKKSEQPNLSERVKQSVYEDLQQRIPWLTFERDTHHN